MKKKNMKQGVLIVTEIRVRKVNGHYYVVSSFARTLEKYSNAFGKVMLVSRLIEEKRIRDGYQMVDEYCSRFISIGSLSSFLFKKTSSDVLRAFKRSNLIILRLPSVVSLKAFCLIRKYSKKYMVEVMGCALDMYWNHGIVGKIIAPFMFFRTRKIVKRADYCLYVTKRFLQKRYPNYNTNIGVSDVDIKNVDTPRSYLDFNKQRFTMMTAAAVDVRYKGQKFVIKAISLLKKKYGIDVIYYLAGGGSTNRLKGIARKYGVENNVVFLGLLAPNELVKYMRDTDFYIQPSLTEGLPRSLAEAMSHGAICFGSDAGGIPELLEPQQIFKRGNTQSIVDTVMDTINSNALSAISGRNVREATAYSSDKLNKKRVSFYDRIKEDLCVSEKNNTDKSKIMIIINRLSGGGAERVTCNLANYLCEKGYSVDIVVTSIYRDSYRLDSRVNKEFLLSNKKRLSRIRGYYVKRKLLKRYLMSHRELSCCVAMMPECAFMLTGLRRFTNAKIIISERNNPPSVGLKDRLMMKIASKKCDGMVVQTKEIAAWYNNVKNLVIIKNAINKDIDYPIRNNVKNRIVAVGRLEEQKNYPMIIAAFREFANSYPNYDLVIFGKGRQEALIKGLIKKNGLEKNVKMMGYVKDISKRLANAKCFVMASNYEGMPNALIEAMCIGVPCVATDCDGGGVRELIKNRENGIMVKKGDVVGMSKAITEIVENDKLSKKISNGAKCLRRELAEDVIYGKWLEFLTDGNYSKKESSNG